MISVIEGSLTHSSGISPWYLCNDVITIVSNIVSYVVCVSLTTLLGVLGDRLTVGTPWELPVSVMVCAVGPKAHPQTLSALSAVCRLALVQVCPFCGQWVYRQHLGYSAVCVCVSILCAVGL